MVTVRTMRPDEAEVVGAITLQAYDRYGTITGSYRRHLGDPAARVEGCRALLVAEDGPALVGTVTYVVPGDREWEHREPFAGDAGLRILAVRPDVEGRGVGSALVQACLDRARAEGRARMLLTSMEWMHRAHRLYEDRFGFRPRPDLDLRYPAGVGHVYALDLRDDADDRFPAPGPVPDAAPWYLDV